MECVEKYLEPGQGWLSRLSSKEVCVGLMWAASTDQVEVLERLMEVETIFSLRSSLASCLMCAVKRGHTQSVRRLVAELRVPLDIANKAGAAPLNCTKDKEIHRIIQEEIERWIKIHTLFYTLHILKKIFSGGRREYCD